MTTIYSRVPPEPNDVPPDPAFFEHVPFVVFDAEGRITVHSDTAMAYFRQKQIEGERVALGAGHWDTDYVDTTGETPVVVARPALATAFPKLELAPREEAEMPDTPPAKVTFSGPVNGTQEHAAAGPLTIGWSVPGAYTVTVEAFPCLPATFEFVVRKP